MSGLKRHIGRLKNTDRKIVVVYMQIPQKETHALIVDTDALPDQFHEFLMTVVESDAGQSTVNLADVLDRRASPDAGINLMNSLHRRGLVRAEPIDNIIMFPRPNNPFPLAQVIALSKPQNAVVPPPGATDLMTELPDNTYVEESNVNNEDIAKGLLLDVDLLEQEIIKKRRQAYELAPHLDPINASVLAMETLDDMFTESTDMYSDATEMPHAPIPVPVPPAAKPKKAKSVSHQHKA